MRLNAPQAFAITLLCASACSLAASPPIENTDIKLPDAPFLYNLEEFAHRSRLEKRKHVQMRFLNRY
jgi:hypothetical protein